MKKLVLILFFFSNLLNIQAQSVQWVKIGTSPGFENGNGITADDSGNVYVTGQVEYSAVFDNITLNTNGSHDIMLVKYNKDGVIQWGRVAGGPGGDVGNALGIDASHNSYIAGELEQTIDFGSGNVLTSAGVNDIFLAKYSTGGQIQWAKSWGTSNNDKGLAVVTSPSGDSYVTGYFGNTMTMGSTTLYTAGTRDVFIAKVNSSGNVVWAVSAGGSNEDKGNGITLDKNGNIYLAGSFITSATFDGITVNNAGTKAGFIAKYDPNGVVQWVRIAGGCCDATSYNAVSVDENNDVYVGGYFYASTTAGSTTLTSAGDADALIAKYNSNGTLQWIKKGGGLDEDMVDGITTDTINHLTYITGHVSAAGSFDSYNYPFSGYRDIILMAYDPSGNFIWGKTNGGTQRDLGSAITCDNKGYIYTTGLFNGTAYFDSYTVVGYPNQPWADFYVDKVSTAPATLPTLNVSNFSINNGTCTNLVLTFVPGNGTGRIVIAHAGSPVNQTPVNGTVYTGNSAFGNGTDLGNGNFIVYNGTGSSLNVSGLSPASTYYFSIIEYSGSGASLNYTGTPVTANATTSNYTITIAGLQNGVCPGDSLYLQASGAATYTWSPSNSVSSTTGSQVSVFPQTVTTYTVNAVNGSGCPAVKKFTVSIYSLPTINFASPNDICVNAASVQLTSASPTGGTYSGPGVTNNSFNPAGLNPGSQTLTYTYTGGNGCTNSANASIYVKPLPTVTFAPIPSACDGDGPILLGGSPSGGTYSGTGVTSGNFYPTTGIGSYTITYSYTGVSGCTNTASQTAVVNPKPSVSLASIPASCDGDGPVALVGNPSGGSYSGVGVTGGSFSPSTGVGSYTVTYIYTTPQGCSNNASQTALVKARPPVSLAAIPTSCYGGGPIALSGSPAGGMYSGTGVVSGNFYPTTGVGSYTINYSVTGSNGCSNNASKTAVVNPSPSIYLGADTSICSFNVLQLTAGSGFQSYTWSTGATTQSITVDSSGTGIGTKLVYAQVSNSFGCVKRDSINVTFDICSGIADNEKSVIRVYPNPFQNTINLSTDDKFSFSVFDFCGKLIERGESIYGKVSAGENLVPGIYLLQIETKASRRLFTIVKMK